MPGNTITINGISEFYVGDSNMDALIEYLSIVGIPENKEAKRLIKDTKVGAGKAPTLRN